MKSLSIAATGMLAQQTNVDVIANNIANMNTTGYKRFRPEFQDLLYQNLRRVGAESSDTGTIVPSGVQIGVGVKTASVYRIPAFEIEAVILDALTDQATGDGLRLNLVNRNRVFFVAKNAAASLVVENLSYDTRSGRFVASLVVAAGTPDEVRAEYSGRAIETVELPALNRLLKRGEIIGDGDIEWLEWPARRAPRDVITDLADLLGMAAKRSLRPGRPLRERDVQEPVVVAKGSAVSLVYRTSNMVLTAGGRALENGAMGSVIRVLNSKSKVVVEARVDGGNVLSVTLSATSLAMN